MPEVEGMHVKVTINDLYKEQQETNKLLIQLVGKVENLSDLPERVRSLEKTRDETSWIPKLLWATVVTAVSSVIASLYQIIVGK